MRAFAPTLVAGSLAAMGLCLAGAVTAATITVPADQPTIQDAVNAAVDGDTILVSDGTYNENVNLDKNLILLSVNGRDVTTIEGMSSMGALGTIEIESGSNGVQIGDTDQGFTIIGIDNGAPGVENAAIYLQGNHSNVTILNNEVVANGDAGLLSEYGAIITTVEISGNVFSGQTFVGPNPAGEGFGMQFTLPNVPRQLVTMGCGGGCTNTSDITFTDNEVIGTAGGLNPDDDEQGNTLVTLDADDTMISGNTFAGTTTRYATSLRARGPNTTISGNVFDASGLGDAVGHIYLQSIGTTTSAVMAANTFDRAVSVDMATGTIGHVLQPVVAAAPGGTQIDITGTFAEQIIASSDIVLQGSGSGSTTLQSPASLATTFGSTNKPVVTVMNTASAEIRDLTVDGLGLGNANNRFMGVAFWNAGGALLDCVVTNIIDTPFSGAQHGIGVYSFNDTGGPYALEVGDCTIDEFQKNGFALHGDGMTVDIHGCDVVGKGDTATIAQNGIQVSFGAGGTVSDCSVSEMRYTPASVVSTGLLIYQSTGVDVDGATLVNAQQPVYYIDAGGDVSGVNASFSGGSEPDFGGIALLNSTSPAPARFPTPSVLAEAWSPAEREARAAISVTLSNGCLTGTGAGSGEGISASSSGEPLFVTVTNMTITGWDTALAADGTSAYLTANGCSIDGNAVGYDNTSSGAAQDASGNWWGAADGPGGDGPGTGDPLDETGFPGSVTVTPFLTDGTSTTACAFSPVGSTVAAMPDPSDCISGPMPCLTVPFEIDRGDTDDLRAYSVTFTLSPELELCAGTGSVVEDTYLSSIGGTVFQVVDNGGGSYTVDCAILGTPCGQTADMGTLFTVDVTTAGSDGTGTITVDEVLNRNCDNDPLAASPGGVASITIDTTAPTAISDLASDQVLTGNDTDGTTAVEVTFTAPGDAALVEVYRKGFGFYPEYDDDGGAVPTTPATPAAALGDGWTLTGVTTSGDLDETTARDFWYYVVFTADACGNVSAASNATEGSLNYHLGDVTMSGGDNDVDGLDVSDLGDSYGTMDGDLDYDPVLDVGPTTDFSTLALPTTDDVIGFEDLLMFAINFGEVSREAPPVNGGPRPYLELVTEVRPGGGIEASLRLHDAASEVKGFHAVVDLRGLELVSAVEGADLGDPAVFWKHLDREGVAVIDAAAMRAGTIGVEGEVARLRLEGLAGTRPALVHQDLRDVANRFLGDAPVNGGDDVPVLPSVLRLAGARPNPFGTETAVRFELPEASRVELVVYDVHGRRVRELTRSEFAAGIHDVTWDGRDETGRRVSPGVYFSRLAVGSSVSTEKLYRQ